MLNNTDLEKIKEIVQDSEGRLTKKIEDESAFLARITQDEFKNVSKRFDILETKFDKLEARTENLEKNMVTKKYLDDQTKDLKGEIALKTKKQDNKLNLTVEVLYNKDVFSKKDVARIDTLDS